MSTKPTCKLTGQDGNVFNLIGIVARTLRSAGMSDEAQAMQKRVMSEAGSYDEALQIMMEYVEVE